MIKSISFVMAFLGVSVALASDFNQCLTFAGKYSKQQGNRDTFSSQGLKIDVDPIRSSLVLTYNSDLDPNEWRGWIEDYIADGFNHAGDVNTGKSYTAACTKDGITIRREGLLLTPLISEISLSGDQLFYEQYAEGGEAHATFLQLKKVQ